VLAPAAPALVLASPLLFERVTQVLSSQPSPLTGTRASGTSRRCQGCAPQQVPAAHAALLLSSGQTKLQTTKKTMDSKHCHPTPPLHLHHMHPRGHTHTVHTQCTHSANTHTQCTHTLSTHTVHTSAFHTASKRTAAHQGVLSSPRRELVRLSAEGTTDTTLLGRCCVLPTVLSHDDIQHARRVGAPQRRRDHRYGALVGSLAHVANSCILR